MERGLVHVELAFSTQQSGRDVVPVTNTNTNIQTPLNIDSIGLHNALSMRVRSPVLEYCARLGQPREREQNQEPLRAFSLQTAVKSRHASRIGRAQSSVILVLKHPSVGPPRPCYQLWTSWPGSTFHDGHKVPINNGTGSGVALHIRVMIDHGH
jgi:hypothetical protein